MKLSSRVYVNNTGVTFESVIHNEIMAALRENRPLGEEVADLITLTRVEVEDGTRGVVDWA